MCRLLLICAFGCLVAVTFGQTVRVWRYNDFPDPHSYDTYSQCRRSNLSNICDPDEIISRDKADEIDSLINSVYRETRCECQHCIDYSHGYVIRVAIMPRMERVFKNENWTDDTHEMLRDAQMYAYLLTDKWAMTGRCNESLLILYSRYDGLLYTLTRRTARQKLNDDAVKRITLAVRPYFDDSNTVAEGLMEMIRRYKLVFEDDPNKALRPDAEPIRLSGADALTPSLFIYVLFASPFLLLLH